MDQAKELLEMPREFLKDGRGFITRCSKRTHNPILSLRYGARRQLLTVGVSRVADKREFLRISQAVGMGFLIMGVIGYVVKLSKFHTNGWMGDR